MKPKNPFASDRDSTSMLDHIEAMNSHKWATVAEAAQHARCGKQSIYAAVAAGRLRAARLGGRRELRFLIEWIDAWLIASATPIIVNPAAPDGNDRLDSLSQERR